MSDIEQLMPIVQRGARAVADHDVRAYEQAAAELIVAAGNQGYAVGFREGRARGNAEGAVMALTPRMDTNGPSERIMR